MHSSQIGAVHFTCPYCLLPRYASRGEGNGDGRALALGALELHPGPVELGRVLYGSTGPGPCRRRRRNGSCPPGRTARRPGSGSPSECRCPYPPTRSRTRLPGVTVTVTEPWGLLYLMALSSRLYTSSPRIWALPWTVAASPLERQGHAPAVCLGPHPLHLPAAEVIEVDGAGLPVELGLVQLREPDDILDHMDQPLGPRRRCSGRSP